MAVSLPVRVELMERRDIPEVHEIERLSFRTPWPSYAFEQELANNRLARYVVARGGAEADEHVVGFAGVWLMVDEAHITTFAVHPQWRRQGVGRTILLRLLELAVELGARRMTLEVRTGNLAAQQLYHSFGFGITGRRRAYYTDDGEDAFVMTTPELAAPGMRSLLVTEQARRDVPGQL